MQKIQREREKLQLSQEKLATKAFAATYLMAAMSLATCRGKWVGKEKGGGGTKKQRSRRRAFTFTFCRHPRQKS